VRDIERHSVQLSPEDGGTLLDEAIANSTSHGGNRG